MRYFAMLVLAVLLSNGRGHSEEACNPYAGWEALAEKATTHVIMFGEVHGTNETADAIGSFLCELIAKKVPVKFGVETSHEQSPALDAAFTWPINRQNVLEAGPDMWPIHDGRSSQAVYDLLSRLLKWRYEGADISIFSYDAGHHEKVSRTTAMAREVDKALKGYNGAVVLFAGDFHTVLNAPDSGKIGGSLANEVKERPVIALKMRHLGGEIYARVSFGGAEAVSQKVAWPPRMPVQAPSRSFDLTPTTKQSGFFYTGPLTASPPAFPEAKAD